MQEMNWKAAIHLQQPQDVGSQICNVSAETQACTGGTVETFPQSLLLREPFPHTRLEEGGQVEVT